jgi:hypothetical protein
LSGWFGKSFRAIETPAPCVRTVYVLAFTTVAYGSFVPQADVSANKMLRSARMAAMTGRAAAFEVVANVGSGPFVSFIPKSRLQLGAR